MAQETWYVLEDGSYAHPEDVSHDKKGLVTADGKRVARREGVDAYSTRSVDPDAQRKAAKPKRGKDDADVEETAEEKPSAAEPDEKAAPAGRHRSFSSYKNRGV